MSSRQGIINDEMMEERRQCLLRYVYKRLLICRNWAYGMSETCSVPFSHSHVEPEDLKVRLTLKRDHRFVLVRLQRGGPDCGAQQLNSLYCWLIEYQWLCVCVCDCVYVCDCVWLCVYVCDCVFRKGGHSHILGIHLLCEDIQQNVIELLREGSGS